MFLLIMIKKLRLSLFTFAPVAIVAIWLNQRNFAIGDDYHALGFYFIMGGMDFSTAVLTYWKSPFMAGRPIAALFELYPLSLMHSINQLSWVRYFHLLIFVVIFGLFWRIIKKCNGSSFLATGVSLFMFTLPGIWHFYLMNYGTPMLLGICAMLLGAILTIKYRCLSFKQWLVFSVLAALSIFSYQPAWPLLFIGLFGKMLSIIYRANGALLNHTKSANSVPKDLDDLQNYSVTFVKALVIVLALFFINFVLVKFGYNSQRLSLHIEWIGKLTYVLNDLLPTTIYPWLYIWFPEQWWLKYLSWATYLLSIVFIMCTLIRSVYRVRGADTHIKMTEFIFILSIATSLMPLTLGMFIFTEQAIALRRVLFASMTFWFTFLFSLSCVLRFPENRQFIKVLNYGLLSFLMLYIFAFGYFLDVGTVQLASREWSAAVCASKQAPLIEPARVNSRVTILPKPFLNALRSEEFQTSTFTYPTGGMLVWLAHLEANHSQPAFNRWNLELKESPALTAWDTA